MKQTNYSQLSATTALEHVDHVHRDLWEVSTGYNYPQYKDTQKNILNEMTKFRGIVEKIDFSKLTSQQQSVLGQLLYESLVETKQYIVLRSHTHYWDSISKKAFKCIYRYQVAAQKIVNEQEMLPGIPAATPALTTGFLVEGADNQITFPVFVSQNPEINSVYNRLRDAWEQAGLKILDTDDTYLLVALASDYLPQSIELMQRLSRHSALAKKQCEQMFLEQLQLMQQQVDGLLAKESDTVLSAMQAHTRFLTGKIQSSTPKTVLG